MWKLGFVFFLSTNIWASHLEKVCSEVVRIDDARPNHINLNPPIFSENYLARKHAEGGYVITDLRGVEFLRSEMPIQGLLELQGRLWVLSGFDLIEHQLDGLELARYTMEYSDNRAWMGKAMTHLGDQIIIARGHAGLVAFDLKQREFTWKTLMPEVEGGMPIALATDGKDLQVVMSNTREAGFSGIVLVNPLTGVTISRTAYDQRRAGVIEPWAKARSYKGGVILNNGGWIHYITAKQLADAKPIRPRWIAETILGDGDVQSHYLILNGEFLLVGESLQGCGMFRANAEGRVVTKSKLVDIKLP